MSMTRKDRPAGEVRTEKSGAAEKKPYRKPEFRHEKVFETLALACGKINGNQGQCHFARKRS